MTTYEPIKTLHFVTDRASPLGLRMFDIRTHKGTAGTLWFLARDVCTALGLTSNAKTGYSGYLSAFPDNATAYSAELNVRPYGPGMSKSRWVTKAGVYLLIQRSTAHDASRFREWVSGVSDEAHSRVAPWWGGDNSY